MVTLSKTASRKSIVRLKKCIRVASLLATVTMGDGLLANECAGVSKVDWTTLPSTYTHDIAGVRVDQFAAGIQPASNERHDYERSGFRHTRSTLQVGSSSDNFHVVDRWGSPVQPYGEWRYPYRPYSVPFGAWGPQSPNVNVQQGNGFGGGFPFQSPNGRFGNGGFDNGGFDNGGFGSGFSVGPQNALRPDQDDYYQNAPEAPPVSDRDFFFVPRRP